MARSEQEQPLAGRRIVVSNGMYESSFAIALAAVREGAEVHVVCSGSSGDVARSRHVSARHAGPEARPAHLSLEAGASLDPYAERMMEVAAAVDADVVIGSTDDEVASLSSMGVADGPTVTVPPIDVVRRMMDKGLSVRAARAAGLVVPLTVEVDSLDDVLKFAAGQAGPVVLKQRVSTTSRGVRVVRDHADLPAAYDELAGRALIAQSWVPGPGEPSISVMRRRDGQVAMDVTLRKQRYMHASLSTSIVAQQPLPEVSSAMQYAEEVGAIGFVGIQLREDPRTGDHVFIESNPRWGANSRMVIPLLRRHGVSPMAEFIDCWECEREATRTSPVSGGAVSPLEDLLALRSLVLLKTTERRGELSWSDIGRSYWSSYVQQRPLTTDDLFRQSWSDPRAWASAARRAVRERHAEIRLIPLGDLVSRPNRR